MAYASMSDWLNELEGFGLRIERVPDGAMGWIETAWTLAAESEREACAKLHDQLEAALRELVDALHDWNMPVDPPSTVNTACVAAESLLKRLASKDVLVRSKKVDCKPMAPRRGGWSDWVEPIMKGYRMQCCDCGLVHEMQFRVVEQVGETAPDGTWAARPIKNGRVSLRARREQ